jgi:rubrerythrin
MVRAERQKKEIPINSSQRQTSNLEPTMQNPPTDETVAALFELAIAAEKAAQDLYQGLESMFSHVPVAAAFWHALMEDEAAHAHELEKTRAALTPMQLVMPADPLMMMKAKSILNFSVEGSL